MHPYINIHIYKSCGAVEEEQEAKPGVSKKCFILIFLILDLNCQLSILELRIKN